MFNNLWLVSRSAKILIDKLKQSKDAEIHPGGSPGDFCSETQTELDNLSADDGSDGSFSPKEHKANAHEVKSYDTCDESEEDITLMSLLRSTKGKRKKKPTCGSTPVASSIPCGSPARSLSRSSGSLTVNRKRVRIILSDDEGENDDNIRSDRISSRCFVEGIATSDERKPRGVVMFILILSHLFEKKYLSCPFGCSEQKGCSLSSSPGNKLLQLNQYLRSLS